MYNNYNILLHLFSLGGDSESDDKFYILLVSTVGGGLSSINILTIVIVCLYCKHYRRTKTKEHPKVVNINTPAVVKMPLTLNPAYGSFPDRKPPEVRVETFNAAYVTATVSNIKCVSVTHTVTDTEIVQNTPNYETIDQVFGADVKLRSNPAYGLFTDRSHHPDENNQTTDTPSDELTTSNKNKPFLNTGTSVDIDTSVDTTTTDVTANGWTRDDGNIMNNTNPTFETATSIKMNVNPPYATNK